METQTNRGRRALAVLAVAALLVAADQAAKHAVLQYLKPVGAVSVIPGLLDFSYVENTAAAMGLFEGMIWLVVAATCVTCVGIVVLLFRYRQHTFFSLATAALLLAGGLGNLLDRMQYGYVVDFIHFLFFPYVFNVADCCVTIGAVCFVLHYILLSRREKRARQEGAAPEEEG